MRQVRETIVLKRKIQSLHLPLGSTPQGCELPLERSQVKVALRQLVGLYLFHIRHPHSRKTKHLTFNEHIL